MKSLIAAALLVLTASATTAQDIEVDCECQAVPFVYFDMMNGVEFDEHDWKIIKLEYFEIDLTIPTETDTCVVTIEEAIQKYTGQRTDDNSVMMHDGQKWLSDSMLSAQLEETGCKLNISNS